MSLENQYNLRSPGVKRLMREALELAKPTEEYYASPLDDNLFEWHFTVRGPPETEFADGFYHGRILLPLQYPMQPPNIILLTPNGRFEVNKKICLSISGYHPETWQPSWSIRTALLALIAFMPTKGVGTIGSLDYTPEERQLLARKSKTWECPTCGPIADKLLSGEVTKSKLTEEESSMLETIALKAEEEEDVNNKKHEISHHPEEALKGGAVPFEPNSVENLDGNVLRQRSVSQVQQELSDEILQASIESSKRDKFWTTVIYIIVLLIALLIVRRIFFT